MANMDLVILAVLQGMPAHGYQIKKTIEESYGNKYLNLSNSALYPKLSKLEEDGYIAGKREEQEGVPDKKVYQMTPEGSEYLKRLAATPLGPKEDHYDFQLHAVLFGLLTPEERRKVTEPIYNEALKDLEDAITKHNKFSQYLDKYSLIVLENGIEDIKQKIALYKKLMDME